MSSMVALRCLVLVILQVLATCSDAPRLLYKLQPTCDPVLLQASTAAEQTDLKLSPQQLWAFISHSAESHGSGWFTPTPRLLPRVLHPHTAQLQLMTYSVFSRVVVLQLASQQAAAAVAAALQSWVGCVDALSRDPQLLLQSAPLAAQGPNDPQLREQWGLFAIDVMDDHQQRVAGAWAATAGEPAVTVALVDSGVDVGHPDLRNNLWLNTGDAAGDGRDDDANGFVDDYFGHSFLDDSSDVSDTNGHGTQLAGVLAAEGNNGVGMSGVCMHARLMALKAFSHEGTGRLSDVVRAMDYALFMGAHIVLLPALSQGGEAADEFGPLKEMVEALSAQGTLLVVPAGNDQQDLDSHPRYPASFKSDTMLVVAASTGHEAIASFSNYGPSTVDLLSPGLSILATPPGTPPYSPVSGTSAAASIVAGVAALLLSDLAASRQPYQGYGAWLKQLLLSSVDYHQQYAAVAASGGRVNAGKAVALQRGMLQMQGGLAELRDSQALPGALSIQSSMHLARGTGPIVRVDVPLLAAGASSAGQDTARKDTSGRGEGVGYASSGAAAAGQDHGSRASGSSPTSSSSSSSWLKVLWDGLRDARTAGLFHSCEDGFRDCGGM